MGGGCSPTALRGPRDAALATPNVDPKVVKTIKSLRRKQKNQRLLEQAQQGWCGPVDMQRIAGESTECVAAFSKTLEAMRGRMRKLRESFGEAAGKDGGDRRKR